MKFHRIVTSILLVLSLSLVFLATPAMADYPDRPITLVVPFGPGGTVDVFARAMAQFMSEKLGVPVLVVDKPGAGTRIGIDYVLRQPADGYTVMASSFSPYMQEHLILDKDPLYKLEDIAFINGQWADPYIIGVHKDAPWQSLPELLADIKNNPKKIRGGTTADSPGEIVLKQLFKAAGIPEDNLNLMLYQNGGMAIPAIVGRQVDFIVNSVTMMERVSDSVRNIAAVEVTPLMVSGVEVPKINDTLKPMGLSIQVLSGGVLRGFAVPMQVKEKYPDRYNKLVATLKAIVEDPKMVAKLKESSFGYDWLGPEKTTQIMIEGLDIMKGLNLKKS